MKNFARIWVCSCVELKQFFAFLNSCGIKQGVFFFPVQVYPEAFRIRFAGAAEAVLGHLLDKAAAWTCLCALAEFVCFQFPNQLSVGGNGLSRSQSAQIFIGKVKALWKVWSSV